MEVKKPLIEPEQVLIHLHPNVVNRPLPNTFHQHRQQVLQSTVQHQYSKNKRYHLKNANGITSRYGSIDRFFYQPRTQRTQHGRYQSQSKGEGYLLPLRFQKSE